MAKIIMIHSFRRGVGRSTIIANITALLATEGRRVGVIDTNIQAPSLHILFNLDEDDITYSLNDYLSRKCDIQQTVHPITSHLDTEMKGEVFFIPASSQADVIARVLKHSHGMEQFDAGLQQLTAKLRLDVLFIDPPSGLTEEALYIISIADTVVILMRPDQQDYQGTGIMIDVIRKLDLPQLLLLVNEVPIAFDLNELRTRIAQTYNCQVAAVVPHSEEMMALDSKGIFVLRYPNNPLTELYRQIANKLMI